MMGYRGLQWQMESEGTCLDTYIETSPFGLAPLSNNSDLLTTVSTGSEDMKTRSGTLMQFWFLGTNCQVQSLKSTCFSIRTARLVPLFLTFINPSGSCYKVAIAWMTVGACVWSCMRRLGRLEMASISFHGSYLMLHNKPSSNFGVETTKMSYLLLFCGFPEFILGTGTGWIPHGLGHIYIAVPH